MVGHARRRQVIVALLCVASLGPGCGRWRYGYNSGEARSRRPAHATAPPPGSVPYDQATAADRRRGEQVPLVYLLDGEQPEILGVVQVTEPRGRESMGIADLRTRAAQLGAGGLTNIQITPPVDGSGPTHFTGVAIRARDLLHGRPYEEVAILLIDAPPQREAVAFTELRRRAGQMNADLLLDVRLVPGEEGRPPRLRARAVRLLDAR